MANLEEIAHSQLGNLFENEELKFLGAVSTEMGEDYSRYEAWLKAQKHGSMFYLEKNRECRRDLNFVLDGVKSVLCFGFPYKHLETDTAFRYAKYAKFEDYHSLLKERGERIVQKLKVLLEDTHHAWRVTVDSAPVLERALSQKTGAGFIGKNTCFIHPRYGSFLLLGEILTTFPLKTEEKSEAAGCGTCTLCQVECPTGALSEEYEIDARKCLAYWTIEHRGAIPFEFWPYLKDYVFGCDICQDVCPYNEEADNALPKSISLRKYPSLFETATMGEKEYQAYFGGTPVTRAKLDGLRRNALIAMTVTQHPQLWEALTHVTQRGPSEKLKETLQQISTYLPQSCLGDGQWALAPKVERRDESDYGVSQQPGD